MATTIAANAEAAFMPVIEPHTHHWLNDLAAARLSATGRTKDLPGFDRLTGFRSVHSGPIRASPKVPGEPWLRSSRVQSGTLRDG